MLARGCVRRHVHLDPEVEEAAAAQSADPVGVHQQIGIPIPVGVVQRVGDGLRLDVAHDASPGRQLRAVGVDWWAYGQRHVSEVFAARHYHQLEALGFVARGLERARRGS